MEDKRVNVNEFRAIGILSHAKNLLKAAVAMIDDIRFVGDERIEKEHEDVVLNTREDVKNSIDSIDKLTNYFYNLKKSKD